MFEHLTSRRDGQKPNHADRVHAAAAFARALEEAERFAQLDASFDPRDLRAWMWRTSARVDRLADTVVAPMRNCVMEFVVDAPWDGSDDARTNAVAALRTYVAATSRRRLGQAVGVSAQTIGRIEHDVGCGISSANRVAGYFCLAITELFEGRRTPNGQMSLHARSLADLRDRLM